MSEIFFKNQELRQEHNRVRYLHLTHFTFTVLSFLLELFYHTVSNYLFFIIKVVLIVSIYSFSYKTVERCLYGFWGFAFLLALYFLYGSIYHFSDPDQDILFFMYFLSLLTLISQCYLFYSPIFYPRVRWWEYDFRYRSDLEVNVHKEGKTFEGRLTDLRRGAGCVVLFESIPAGQNLELEGETFSGTFKISAEIITKREYCTGRGYTYGVKFMFENDLQRNKFDQFVKYWQINHKTRIQAKFENG